MTTYKKLQKRHPGHVPVIVSVGIGCPCPLKSKFLTPNGMTFGGFISIVRGQMPALLPSEAIFAFVGNDLVPCTLEMLEVHKRYAEHDGVVHVHMIKETVFGNSLVGESK
jgi:hypothetical protein